MSQTPGPATPLKISRARKALYAAFTSTILLILVFALGEVVVRWNPKNLRKQSADWLVPDPDLGYKLNPDFPNVNSLGIQHGEITAKTERMRRVIVLGDSVAWLPDGFVGILADHFEKSRDHPVEVINAAIPGYTTYQERTLLERDLLKTKPDLVLLQYCLNDNHRFLHELDQSGRWLTTPEARDALFPPSDTQLAKWLQSSQFLTLIRIRTYALMSRSRRPFPWEDRPGFAAAWKDHTWPDYENHVTAIRDELAAIGSKLAVVAVPYSPQLREDLLERDHDYTVKPQRKLRDICNPLQIPLLDLHAAFVENRERKLFIDGIHLTEAGHRLVADQIVEFLNEKNLGP